MHFTLFSKIETQLLYLASLVNLIYGNNEAECDPEQRNVTTVSLDLYKVSLSDNFLLLCERVTVHYLRSVTRSCHIFHTPQRISDVCQLRGKFKSPVVTVDTWFKNTKDTAVLDLVFIERLIEILSRLAFFVLLMVLKGKRLFLFFPDHIEVIFEHPYCWAVITTCSKRSKNFRI